MKNIRLTVEIALIFIGSIVGAGVCSGRELNQFFATYGLNGFVGLIICGILYIIISGMIIRITDTYQVSSYDSFVALVCPKYVALFINVVLTLFLLSSTSIILAGSGAIMHQYFNLPNWMGTLLMIGLSSFFLLRETKGLFEVNTLVVPTLIVVMVSLFITYLLKYPETGHLTYMRMIPRQKTNLALSTLVYVSFNILTIIGVIVPLVHKLRNPKPIFRGVVLGSIILTLVGSIITFLMLVNPFYPALYEMPLLGIAMDLGPLLRGGLLMIMWLEMFSSQISNIYSLSFYLENRFSISYKQGIFLVMAIALPFSTIGFANLVEFLYPMYGVLSLVFLIYCAIFTYQKPKGQQITRPLGKMKGVESK